MFDWLYADTASGACPAQSGSPAMTSSTFATVIWDADESRSVYRKSSSVTTFFFSLCASRITSFLLFTSSNCQAWQLCELLPSFVQGSFRIWDLHRLEHRKTCEPIYSDFVDWTLSPLCDVHDFLEDLIPKGFSWIPKLPRCILCLSVGFCDPTCCSCLQLPQGLFRSHLTRHNHLQRYFQLFPCVFEIASWNSSSSGSMKQMHLRFRALSSFGFSMVHSCCSFFLAACKIPDQISENTFSGLVVAWTFVSRLPDYIYPRGFVQ